MAGLRLFLTIAAGWPSQDTTSKTLTQQVVDLEQRPKIQVLPLDSSEVVAWRELRLRVRIENRDPHGIGIVGVSLSVPSDFAVQEPKVDTSSACSQLEIIQLNGIGDDIEPCPFRARAKSLASLLPDLFEILTFRPRSEIITATVAYKSLRDPSQGRQIAVGQTRVQVQPHPMGMYFGALWGALLAGLLVFALRTLPQTIGSGQKPARWRPEIRDVVTRFLRGAVASGIIVLLLQTTSDFSLPISIKVHDFYGGVLLGLFGDIVAKEVHRRLQPEEKTA